LDGLVQPPTRRNLLKDFQKLQNLFLPGQHLLFGTCELDEEEMAEYVGSFNEMSLVARQASTLTCNLCCLWLGENVKKIWWTVNTRWKWIWNLHSFAVYLYNSI